MEETFTQKKKKSKEKLEDYLENMKVEPEM